jgi:cytochrome c oxidase cbb3-type subunit 3
MMDASMLNLKPIALDIFCWSMLFALGGSMLVSVGLAQTQVETGQQLYRANCFACHGPDGDQVNGVNLRSGQFRHATTDDDLAHIIDNGIPGTGMPPTAMPEASRRALVAYLRSLHAATGTSTAVAGDAAHGQTIFEGKGGCLGCHRVGEKGSHTGPGLNGIGGRPADYLQKSILDPNETVAPQNRYVRAVKRDGTVVIGRRLNEDTHTIQLIDDKERLVSLDKSQLRELTIQKTSPMPSYQGKLSAQEVADLVAYLQTLR